MKKLLLAGAALGLCGCSTLAYYRSLAAGQYELLSRRESIETLLARPGMDPAFQQRLRTIQEARRYSVQALSLPDNGSYTQYTDLQRPYVAWNVMAAAEFSVEPMEHCFWIVGCIAYRGYFKEEQAHAEAERLRGLGFEAHVAGVPAYSTLGWFDDPVLSSMMQWNDEWLIGTLFHELAHQVLYIRDDTAYNESFASFVEDEGLRQYLQSRGGSSAGHRQLKRRQQQFTELMLHARDRLKRLYEAGGAPEQLRQSKRAAFEQLRREYVQLRDGPWGGWRGYDRWFEGELGNAHLVLFALYDGWVPAFAGLFEETGRHWPAFYEAARELGARPPAQREQRLRELGARQ